MQPLTSKVQYHNYEPGEFTLIKERSLEETIELIKSFPWQKEREHISIGFTNPSVCIENLDNYLKIAPSYNGKYCLYLFTDSGKIFKKVIDTIDNGFDLIADFYGGKYIENEFNRLRNLWGVKEHFVTNDFIYVVTNYRIKRFMRQDMIMAGIFVIPFLFNPKDILLCLLVFLFAGTIMFGVNISLLLNYYRYSKNQYLRASRGHDHFLFGMVDNYKEYTKKEISTITYYKNTNGRCPWSRFTITKITLKSGEELKFCSLLCDGFRYSDKEYDIKWALKPTAFPFIK